MCLTFLNSYVCRVVFLADLRVPRTIKSSWHHPSQSPLVRSAFQGLADHPIGLSTAPAPAQSVHCASARHAYIHLRPCTHARTECAGGFTDTRRYIQYIYVHTNTHTYIKSTCAHMRCGNAWPRERERSWDTTCHRCVRTRKTDHVAFRDTFNRARVYKEGEDSEITR